MAIRLILILGGGMVVLLAVLAVVAWLLARAADADTRELGRRIVRLPWRRKLALMRMLMRDREIPGWLRAIPPGLVLYLAMPLDIIPDFIPVLGQIDDAIVLAVGIALLVRLLPRERLRAAVLAAEAVA